MVDENLDKRGMKGMNGREEDLPDTCTHRVPMPSSVSPVHNSQCRYRTPY